MPETEIMPELEIDNEALKKSQDSGQKHVEHFEDLENQLLRDEAIRIIITLLEIDSPFRLGDFLSIEPGKVILKGQEFSKEQEDHVGIAVKKLDIDVIKELIKREKEIATDLHRYLDDSLQFVKGALLKYFREEEFPDETKWKEAQELLETKTKLPGKETLKGVLYLRKIFDEITVNLAQPRIPYVLKQYQRIAETTDSEDPRHWGFVEKNWISQNTALEKRVDSEGRDLGFRLYVQVGDENKNPLVYEYQDPNKQVDDIFAGRDEVDIARLCHLLNEWPSIKKEIIKQYPDALDLLKFEDKN